MHKGVVEAMASGGPHGYPVVDLRVEVYDGKSHSVDSSDMAFRTAAATGVREALHAAGTIVLEPISHVSVTVPIDRAGRRDERPVRRAAGTSTRPRSRSTTGWCSSRRRCRRPSSARYVLDLRSLTGGRAELSIEPDRFEVCPDHLVPA